MTDKLLLALIAAGSAVVGGLITSVLSPWVKHRIERSAGEIDRKRQLIAEWRNMITTIANATDKPDEARSILQSHPAFLSLEPHLSDEARRAAYAREFIVASGVKLPYPLHTIKVDISRIEKLWRLAK
jgi:hypothetical protein